MSVRKGPRVKGRAAKAKGSRAEIQVRNLLRTIYPVELRSNVYRVPLSGAGALKCDVMDTNDYDMAYEVKNQETLCLPDWWRQAKSQAGNTRTPCLVVTQSFRPFYFILKKSDWDTMRDNSAFFEMDKEEQYNSTQHFMDRMSKLDARTVGRLDLDGDDVVSISSSFYLEVKKDLYEQKVGGKIEVDEGAESPA